MHEQEREQGHLAPAPERHLSLAVAGLDRPQDREPQHEREAMLGARRSSCSGTGSGRAASGRGQPSKGATRRPVVGRELDAGARTDLAGASQAGSGWSMQPMSALHTSANPCVRGEDASERASAARSL
jgi:hypothetical protein